MGITIGHRTYFAEPPVLKGGMNAITIDNYSSIGAHVTFDCGWDHNTRYISTFPFHTLGIGENNNVCRGDISVGSDVWIGDDSIIKSGVTIGHGSIIGTRSFISKDVEPYSIVVGPNRVVKKRFNEMEIEKLLVMQWWNWSDAQVQETVKTLQSRDIAELWFYYLNSVK